METKHDHVIEFWQKHNAELTGDEMSNIVRYWGTGLKSEKVAKALKFAKQQGSVELRCDRTAGNEPVFKVENGYINLEDMEIFMGAEQKVLSNLREKNKSEIEMAIDTGYHGA